MRINELAGRLNVTPRAIRYYEQKNLLDPAKEANGYRRYTEEDVRRLQTIIALREVGIGLNDIVQVLKVAEAGNRERVRQYLEAQRMELFSQWVEAKITLSALDGMIGFLDERQEPGIEQLCTLAAHLKTVKTARSSWRDRWNFDLLAERFDKEPGLHAAGVFATERIYEAALDMMVQWISPLSDEIGLDIGAGTGKLAARLMERGADMCAVEQSVEMLARCRSRNPLIKAKRGNFLALPYVDGHFNFVATSFAFHHLTEQQQTLALEEIARVLKPNGRICIASVMFENAVTREQLLAELRSNGRHEVLGELANIHPADRSHLLDWFRRHEFITVQQRLNDWIHTVYAVSKK